MSLAEHIVEHAQSLPEGATLRAKELLHLGPRASIDQAMTRLERSGELVRVSRGLYMLPVQGRFGPRPPSPATALKALSAATGEIFAAHGAVAANALGLSTQVPMKAIYLTSGRSRRLKVGGQWLDLRHAPEWQLLLPGQPAGDAVRALSWGGREHAGQTINQLRRKLPGSELKSLLTLRGRLPSWLAQEVSSLVHA